MIERLYSGIGKGAMDAVEISHVSKTFGDVRAVNDLSLKIPRGRGLWIHRAERLGENHDHADDREHLLSG